MAHFVIGTRGNQLALQQANWIKQKLELAHPGALVGLEILSPDDNDTAKWQEDADAALLARRVDAVLYHLSELPARLPEDFHIAAITERIEPRDALLVRPDLGVTINSLSDLPPQSRVVASGWHRRVQLAAQQPQLQFIENADSLASQLEQLAAGTFDALVVDGLSLALLEAQSRVALWLSHTECLPAAGQGVFALQSRLEDQRTNLMLENLNHAPTRYATNAERALVRNLYGEIGDAIAAHAIFENGQLTLTGVVGDATLPPAAKLIRAQTSGEPRMGELLGGTLAVQLLNAGARELLQRTKTSQALNETAATINELFPAAYDLHSDFDQPAPTAFAQPSTLTLTSHEASLAHAASARIGFPARSSMAIPLFGDETANEFDLVATKVRNLRDQQPLHDQRILLARGNRNSPELIQKLEALGAQLVQCPTARIEEPATWEALDKVLVHMSWYDWLGFAHPESVESFMQRLKALGHHRQEVESHLICAIGQATAERLQAHELQADLVLSGFNAEAFAEAWEKRAGKREELRGKTMLFLATQAFALDFKQASRHPLRSGFDKLGLYVETAEAYRLAIQAAPEWEQCKADEALAFDYAIIQQAASVSQLATVIEPQSLAAFLATTRVVSLNDSAREALRANGVTPHFRGTDSNLRAVVKWIRDDCQQRRA